MTGPNVNGIELRSNFSATDQPLAARGFLDVTKPPFSADPSGKNDATAAIQAAVLAARASAADLPEGRLSVFPHPPPSMRRAPTGTARGSAGRQHGPRTAADPR